MLEKIKSLYVFKKIFDIIQNTKYLKLFVHNNYSTKKVKYFN